jgi:hypothetical protein
LTTGTRWRVYTTPRCRCRAAWTRKSDGCSYSFACGSPSLHRKVSCFKKNAASELKPLHSSSVPAPPPPVPHPGVWTDQGFSTRAHSQRPFRSSSSTCPPPPHNTHTALNTPYYGSRPAPPRTGHALAGRQSFAPASGTTTQVGGGGGDNRAISAATTCSGLRPRPRRQTLAAYSELRASGGGREGGAVLRGGGAQKIWAPARQHADQAEHITHRAA